MQVSDKNRQSRGTALLAVVCAVLQLALAPNVGLASGRVNFALVFAALVSLGRGGRAGILAGFLSGLFFDLSTTGPIGLMAFCLTLVGFCLGREERNRLGADLGPAVPPLAAATLATSLAYSLAMLLVGQADSLVDAVAFRALPTALLTLLAFVPFAVVLSGPRGPRSPLGRTRGAGHFPGARRSPRGGL